MNNLPLHNFVNSAAMTQSAQQQKHSAGMSKQILALMSQVRSNFQAQELTPETSALWLDAWSDLAQEFGIDLVRDSLQRHCRMQRFLPLPADVRDGILAIRQERAEASAKAAAKHWSVEDYRRTRDFDAYLAEQIQIGKTREQILRQFPGMSKLWIAWSNQRNAGTLHCPGWCDTCSGDRVLIEFRDEESIAVRCPTCRASQSKQQAA